MLAGDDKQGEYRSSFHGSAFCVSVATRFGQKSDFFKPQFLQQYDSPANRLEIHILLNNKTHRAMRMLCPELAKPQFQLRSI